MILNNVLIGLSILFIGWLLKIFYMKCYYRCIEENIILFLNQSLYEVNLGIRDKGTFRSINAISSALNVDKEKVTFICDNSNYIRGNKKEKASWTLRKYGVKQH